MKLKKRSDTKCWDDRLGRFCQHGQGHVITLHSDGHLGAVTLTGGCINNPWMRHQMGKELGVRIEPIHDVGHLVYLPDGRNCKPNWFDDNVIVVLDREHRVAIPYQVEYHGGSCIYPTPDARPHSYNVFTVHPPNIKAGNAKLKELESCIGEAKLRLGVLSIPKASQLCEQAAAYVLRSGPDMTNPEHLRALAHPNFLPFVRKETRDHIITKELVYEP